MILAPPTSEHIDVMVGMGIRDAYAWAKEQGVLPRGAKLDDFKIRGVNPRALEQLDAAALHAAAAATPASKLLPPMAVTTIGADFQQGPSPAAVKRLPFLWK